jgi:hypothetical protein
MPECQDSVARCFREADANQITKQVVLDQELLLFFQWAESSQDKPAHRPEKEDDEPVVTFVFQLRSSNGLQPHAHLVAIRTAGSFEIAEEPSSASDDDGPSGPFGTAASSTGNHAGDLDQ